MSDKDTLAPVLTATASGDAPCAAGCQRESARIAQAGIAFVQPLDAGPCAPFRVNLIDTSPKGAGIRAMIPVPKGAMVVLSIAHHPPLQGLFLSRVAHCTKLGNGWYHIGMVFLDRREGNLNTTRIPQEWRQR